MNPEKMRTLPCPSAQLLALALFVFGFATATLPLRADNTNTNAIPSMPTILTQPLSLSEAVNVALQNNGDILKAKHNLEAQYGVVIQTRAIAIPHLNANGNYQYTDEVETFPAPGFNAINHTWAANIQLVQTIYQGGQVLSSLRTARLTKDQAMLDYETVVADSLLAVRVAYYDVLAAAEQVVVNEASVTLLTRQLDDQQRRFEAGTVPRFNVLQAEVALANERPALIQARNAYRIAKNNLVNVLGKNVPRNIWEDIPLQLTDKLDSDPYKIELPSAIGQALATRSELLSLRKQELLRKEGITSATSTYKPTVQLFGGYGARNAEFITDDPGYTIKGASAGAQVTWSIFDGLSTKGKADQAKALYEGAKVDIDNEGRRIELEVRTDYSNFIEATETLESQKKVQEEAVESLRLAKARADAGTGTQLDVLSAQTSLTQARSTEVQALHDYDVARARLERAIGIHIMPSAPPPAK
jgi:outer membrane protein TolC